MLSGPFLYNSSRVSVSPQNKTECSAPVAGRLCDMLKEDKEKGEEDETQHN